MKDLVQLYSDLSWEGRSDLPVMNEEAEKIQREVDEATVRLLEQIQTGEVDVAAAAGYIDASVAVAKQVAPENGEELEMFSLYLQGKCWSAEGRRLWQGGHEQLEVDQVEAKRMLGEAIPALERATRLYLVAGIVIGVQPGFLIEPIVNHLVLCGHKQEAKTLVAKVNERLTGGKGRAGFSLN